MSSLIVYFFPVIKTIIYDDWPDTFWKNTAMIYASTDLVSLLVVRRNKLSTIIHHISVVASCLICICVGNFQTDYLWKALILYGLFSALACGANLFLGMRFLVEKNSIMMMILNYSVMLCYIMCCFFNWSIQTYYLMYYIPVSILSILYMCCVFFFVKDDLLLIKFQMMYYFNNNQIKND